MTPVRTASHPEVVSEQVPREQKAWITLVTSAETDDEARELLKLLGMPFRRVENVPAPAAKSSAA